MYVVETKQHYRQTDGWTDEWMGNWVDRRRTDEHRTAAAKTLHYITINGWTDGRMDGQLGGQTTDRRTPYSSKSVALHYYSMKRYDQFKKKL